MKKQGSLDKAIEQFPVVSWLREHVETSDTGGLNFYATCPVCKGKRKLGVHRQKKIFHCFYCYEGGHGGNTWNGKCGLVGMVRIIQRVSVAKAIQFIHERAGVPDNYVRVAIAERPQLPGSRYPLAELGSDHASSRFVQDRRVSHLTPKLSICVDGRYAGRLIIPVEWDGEFVGFEAKSYNGGTPKALYPTWFHTADYLYLCEGFDPKLGFVVLTESIFDAEAVRINGIGLFGSTVKPGQVSRLFELREQGISKIVWMLDWDAFKKQSRYILENAGMFDNYICNLPTGSDPSSIGHEACVKLIEQAVPIHDALDLVIIGTNFGRGILEIF